MDFIEELQNLSARIDKQKDLIQSEEATKNAFIMPFELSTYLSLIFSRVFQIAPIWDTMDLEGL